MKRDDSVSHPSLQPGGILPVAPSAILAASQTFTPNGWQLPSGPLNSGSASLEAALNSSPWVFTSAELPQCASTSCSSIVTSSRSGQRRRRLTLRTSLICPISRICSMRARSVAGLPMPVYALGGISGADLGDAWSCGAHGIAMLRGVWQEA